MDNHVRGIVELKDYGKVEIKLKTIMDKKKISVYQLSQLASLKHSTVKNYYNNCPITRVDLDVISKLCYVLDCKIQDILEYKYPN
jgi:putative transcriptional regulator